MLERLADERANQTRLADLAIADEHDFGAAIRHECAGVHASSRLHGFGVERDERRDVGPQAHRRRVVGAQFGDVVERFGVAEFCCASEPMSAN